MAKLTTIVKYLVDDHGPDGHQYFPGRSAIGSGYDQVVTGQGDNRYEAFEDAVNQLAELDYDVDAGIPAYKTLSFEGDGKLTAEQLEDDETDYYCCIFVR